MRRKPGVGFAGTIWEIFKFPIEKGLGRTLLLWLIAISLVPLSVVSIVSYKSTYDSLHQDAIRSLSATSRLKTKFIEEYFASRMNDLRLQSNLHATKKFLSQLIKTYDESGLKLDKFIWSYAWERMAREHGADMIISQLAHGYDDVIVIDYRGNILFTAMGEKDLGTNIFFGKYASTQFGAACRVSFDSGKTVYSDLEFYGPSSNELASFITQPVNDEDGTRLGLIAFRIPVSSINKILQDRTGLGKTGDIFLIGTDLKMRSVSRFSDTSSVLKSKVESALTRRWLESVRARESKRYSPVVVASGTNTMGRKAPANEDSASYTPESMIYLNKRGIEVLGIYEELEIGNVLLAVVTEIGVGEAFGLVLEMKKVAIILLIITGFIVSLISVVITRRIVTPIIQISDWARKVTSGDLSYEKVETPDNELGVLNESFKDVVRSYQSVTEVCESISIGDLSKSFDVRSEKDRLGKSVNRMSDNLRAVVHQANSIAKGDYSAEINPHSESDELAEALIHMTATLKKATSENERQNWMNKGKTELADIMRGEQDTETLCRNVIAFLSSQLRCQAGAIFLVNEGNVLRLTGSYAFAGRKNVSNQYCIGEGLIGQAALAREKILIKNVPSDYMKIESGLAEGPPNNVIIAPFLFEGEVKGVIEIASFHEFEKMHIEFLDQVLESIAVHVNSSQSRLRLNALLEESQVQSVKLQAQQEELRQINEELEEQARALKDSEATLQNQQEELQQANEELEERTEALEKQRDETKEKNIELEMAQKAIEEKAKELELSNKYKSEFLANMSHELRTPLNSILVLSQLLCENKAGNLEEKQVEFAKTVHSSANDLLSLINEILDLSKVEAGKMEIHIEEMSLTDFSNGIERMFSPVAERKGLEFRIDIDNDLPDGIRTDRQRTEQIIKNLISNAFKFTSKGSVVLKIRRPPLTIDLSQIGLDHETSVAFAVQDSGEGISKDKQKVIFDAFKQANGTTSRKYGGTGLGLTICREFATLLSGDIHLHSIEGRGSTFTLILPETIEVKEETAADRPPETEGVVLHRPEEKVISLDRKPEQEELEQIAHGDREILIIEDDQHFAKILSDLAREKGFKCLIAGDGEKGLKLAESYRPGAIILDIGLPGIDGMSVMEKLKENPATSRIPVHFISGSDMKMDAMRMGSIGFLLKPASADKIAEAFNKIERFISRPVKNLVLAADDDIVKRAILDMAGNGKLDIKCASTGKEANDMIRSTECDCVILDLDISGTSGFELLSKIKDDETIAQVPFIVYANRDLSKEEEEMLSRFSEDIAVQWAKSPEKLVDEAALFLHHVRSQVPRKKSAEPRIVLDRGSVLKDKKVLLVDDDMRNIFALSSVLEEIGLDVVAGKNGREAIERLEENPDIDLVLMDIMMPEMDGNEAMKEIRKKERYKNLPIIALTAKAMKGDRKKCIESGANDYLSKPVDIDKLITLIRVYLCQ